MDNDQDDGLSKEIGKRLAAARLSAGYESQREFAKALGISLPAVSKYEQGARDVPFKVLKWLSDRHSINIDWIVTGQGGPWEKTGNTPSFESQAGSVVDVDFLQQISDYIEDIYRNNKQIPPPRALISEASKIYNSLVQQEEFRDPLMRHVALKTLLFRFDERIRHSKPGDGKRSA